MNFFNSIPQFLQDLEDHKVDYHAALIYFEIFKDWYCKQPLDGDNGIILKLTKRQLFDAFRDNLPKFYVDHIYWKYDSLKQTKERFAQNQQANNIELIQLLQEQLATKDLPQTLQDEINLIITNLSDEVQTQEVGE